MADAPFTIVQNLFKHPHPPIRVTPCHETNLSRDILQKFLDTASDGVIGVSPAYGARSVLAVLAFASSKNVLLVHLSPRRSFKKGKHRKQTGSSQRDLLQELICANTQSKFAFRMDILATSLYLDLGIRITGAVDLLSSTTDNRQSLSAIMNVMGEADALSGKSNLAVLFKHDESATTPARNTALQAWAAWRAGLYTAEKHQEVPRIDTKTFEGTRLATIAKMVRDARRLVAIKPIRVENEIDGDFSCKNGKLQVTSTRYKTRILASRNQTIEIKSTREGKHTKVMGRKVRVDGRAAQITLDANFGADTIRITTLGRDGFTYAEEQRTTILLKALQRTSAITYSPFFKAIWLPHETLGLAWLNTPRSIHPISLYFPHAELNSSQKDAVDAVLSNQDEQRIILIQGPPGTGKTTVIAASIFSILSSSDLKRTVWIVAQSNVAVKNIAEKLADVKCDFTLLVSKDFHHDWHEHLYGQIIENVVRSDELVGSIDSIERRILGTRVVLCTLSMISSPRIASIARLVPVETVMVDEASQIEMGNFLPLLSTFSGSLQKMVFIGDDRQLAPHGQKDIPSLKSIFEFEHLREGAIFLDTQYRMPLELGSFIGKHVYNDRLQSVHPIDTACCRFIDVKGIEAAKGSSWINVAEVRAVIAQAHKYHEQGKSYRILTPYDAQRAMLEAELKASKLPWEDKVFCVDSFQGNEDDYIILSVVRTEKIGFLAEPRRVNVMLSRCKKGMEICTNRAFAEGKARDTLLGLLAISLGPNAWDI